MKNLEYGKFAYIYDTFYQKKNYLKEVDFILSFVKNKDVLILDAGAGTGNHAKILNDLGYRIFGFDKSQDMVRLANEKLPGHFEVGNLLSFRSTNKYDVIISFFAVFNHLKSYREFKPSLINLKNCLTDNGVIIIDLHNPQSSGEKIETIDGLTRKMKWRKCDFIKKEFSKITYFVNNEKFVTKHVFKIFNINKIANIAKELGFKKFDFFENYNINKIANKKSKNIQLVLSI